MSDGSGILEAIEVGSCWFDRWRSTLTDMEMSLPKCQRVRLGRGKGKIDAELYNGIPDIPVPELREVFVLLPLPNCPA